MQKDIESCQSLTADLLIQLVLSLLLLFSLSNLTKISAFDVSMDIKVQELKVPDLHKQTLLGCRAFRVFHAPWGTRVSLGTVFTAAGPCNKKKLITNTYNAINTVIIYVSCDWSVKREAWVTF